MGHVSSGLGKSKSFFSILASWNRSKLEFKPKRERMLSLSTLNTTYLHVHAQKGNIYDTTEVEKQSKKMNPSKALEWVENRQVLQ